MSSPRKVIISGSGSFLPGAPVDNARIQALIPDLPMEVLSSYLGIDQRYMVVDPETCERVGGLGSLEMAVNAARTALAKAEIGIQDIDAIITNTTTPESPLPPISFLLQRALGVSSAQIFDLRGGCAASVQAMLLAKTLIESGQADTVLLCGVECTSPIYFKHLRQTSQPDMDEMLNGFIFGDGAGALVLQSADKVKVPASRTRRLGYCATASRFASKKIGFEITNEVDANHPMVVTTKTKHFNRAIGQTLPLVMEAAFSHLTKGVGCSFEDFQHIIVPQVNESLLKVAYPEVVGSFVYYFRQMGNIPGAAIYLAYDKLLASVPVPSPKKHDAIVAIETVSWTYAVAELIHEA